MAVAIRGAVIVGEYEGAYTNQVTYRQRCDACGYITPKPSITVSCLPGDTVMHGCYHRESFLCPWCESHQRVEIEG